VYFSGKRKYSLSTLVHRCASIILDINLFRKWFLILELLRETKWSNFFSLLKSKNCTPTRRVSPRSQIASSSTDFLIHTMTLGRKPRRSRLPVTVLQKFRYEFYDSEEEQVQIGRQDSELGRSRYLHSLQIGNQMICCCGKLLGVRQ